MTKSENIIVISLKNTAENLSELQVEKLFTRFYQKDEYAEGAGVGLSLVKKLVQLCHGEITAKIENENVVLQHKKFNKKIFEFMSLSIW